jgi:hypothetical protein
LIIAYGSLLLLIGLYFLFLRPALLPEDLRYIGVVQPGFDAVAPQLGLWLKQVFRVMGGYVAATGLLTIALAATAFRTREPAAVAGLLLGGLSSIGLMVAINFMIDSDFKWQLLAIALVWAAGMISFWFEGLRLRESGLQ